MPESLAYESGINSCKDYDLINMLIVQSFALYQGLSN